MKRRIFKCDGCGGTFYATNTEAERDVEAAELYAGTPDDEQASCCDSCHLRVLEMIKVDPGRVEADKAQEMYADFVLGRK